jgi:hypothetical protein
MTQPPLSRAIKQLGTDVGALLLHRSPAGVTLTPAGTTWARPNDMVAARIPYPGAAARGRAGFRGSADVRRHVLIIL